MHKVSDATVRYGIVGYKGGSLGIYATRIYNSIVCMSIEEYDVYMYMFIEE